MCIPIVELELTVCIPNGAGAEFLSCIAADKDGGAKHLARTDAAEQEA